MREAIENDVHVIGISSQAAGHKTLVPQVIDGLKKAGAGDIIVICGGVIPPQDHAELLGSGVAADLWPGHQYPRMPPARFSTLSRSAGKVADIDAKG